jgi:mono/diheme cytochrome c family protein
VFPNGQMPVSKAKPNRGYIMVRSKFGGKIMPAFRDKLTDAQINLIIDYIESK